MLSAGTSLGPYEILSALGAGAMGEVYRARDTKLGREVALKVLPDSFTTDPDRVARFRREAQVLAALSHPHIGAIYGLEETNGQQFLVLELIAGETLADRIAKGPLPVDEAVAIAKQIAEALEAAHEKGITHRDLKPANIALTTDGQVKVLDFGLAKVSEAASGATFDLTNSPTLTSPAMMTGVGVILGTAAYMSPEQAKGRPADKRTDIWAFGCVLFEMLTGRRAFDGEDVSDTLANVLKSAPDWAALPATVSAPVRTLLTQCLEKDRTRRMAAMAVARFLLSDSAFVLSTSSAARRDPAPVWRRALPWGLIATLAVGSIVVLVLWPPWRSPRPVERPLVRLDVDLGSDVSLGSPQGTDVIISPDGSRLVFVSNGRLFTRRLDQPKAIELAGTSGAYAPFFSPDGQWVAFFATRQLKKISVEGGAAVTLCGAVAGFGGSWSENGTIVASLNGSTLSRLPAAGGTPTMLTALAEGETALRWPQILPGGKAVLFSVRRSFGTFDDAHIDLVSFRDGRRTTLLRGGTFGRYLATSKERGVLMYVNQGTVFGVPFDLERLDVSGTPSPVLAEVGFNNVMGAAQIDASQNGTLVYRSRSGGGLVSLQWLDAAGKTERLPAKPGAYANPHVSPVGPQLALSIITAGGQDIWVYDWQRDRMSRLTFGGGTFVVPLWYPDGQFIAFTGAGSGGMFWTRADGAGKPQLLMQSKNLQIPGSFSPDGKRLAFADISSLAGLSQGDIWTVPVENDGTSLKTGKPEVFLQTPANEIFPAFSPDGRWIAYQSNESATDEIYVRAFPDRGGKSPVSNGGGLRPVWSRNGRELFYRTADQHIMVVAYTVKGGVFVADKPRLWTEKRLADTPVQNFDIAPDGKRFLALMPASAPDEQQAQNHVVFLLNFADDVRRRVGGRP
jgi:serine/threonine protein kinase/Tol biopolymer transport system component